jgi:hypothetical protein
VADEVIAVLEHAGDELCVGLEVHSTHGRIRREARTLDEDDLETLDQRALRTPGRGGAEHAPVDEHETLHESSLALQRSGLDSPFSSETECYKLADMLRPG